jgi:hypothetical protein
MGVGKRGQVCSVAYFRGHTCFCAFGFSLPFHAVGTALCLLLAGCAVTDRCIGVVAQSGIAAPQLEFRNEIKT